MTKDKIFRYSLIASFLFNVLVVPINERIAFTAPISGGQTVLPYLLKSLFALISVFVLYFGINFINRLYLKDQKYVSWFYCSMLYFILLSMILLLIYPGHWIWDEYSVLSAIKSYSMYSWQGYFTAIYYTFCLYVFPSAISVVFIQITIISLIVGYIVSNTMEMLKNRGLGAVLFILFLMPPVILNNYYPLRLTIYSYLEMLFIFKLLYFKFKSFKPINVYMELIIMSLLIMLLSFWRTEGIYYLATFPILVYYSGVITKRTATNFKVILCITVCLVIIISGYVINKKTSESSYAVTAVLNPISVMIQKDLSYNGSETDLINFDKVISINAMKQYPSYTEIPAFWVAGLKPNYNDHLKSFYKSFINLVLNNPKDFISARTKTFLAANGQDSTTIKFLPVGLRILNGSGPSDEYGNVLYNEFLTSNRFVHPINFNVKRSVTRTLLFLNNNDKLSIIGRFVWSTIPIMVVLILTATWKLLNKDYFTFFIICLVMARVPILFMFSPASYFMYFLPVYLSGGVIIYLQIIKYIDYKTTGSIE